ncbi:MAG: sensor histidine kinase [Propionivibrio sp.]|uniref:sensor histidine kinase n=1 Tax=Propionivibrio sp. TaxID=2212460 RepID=UPI001A4D6E5E|nr:sensor histidine kinase [Propionivibrio sp.]MBL8413334.1 sensor histidine kinase [Propionivibrio sp.]
MIGAGTKQPSTALRGSLRLRLLLGTLVWIAVSIVAAGWALGSLFSQHVAMQFHAELNTHLDQLAAHLVLDRAGQPLLPVAQSDPRFSKPYSGIYWQIDRIGPSPTAALGLLRSRSLWDEVLRLPADTLRDGEVHQHSVPGPGNARLGVVERVVTIEDAADRPGQTFRLLVAADEQQMHEPVENFKGMLWLALGMLGFGLGLAVVFQVLVGLAPLRRLHGALAAVRNGSTQKLEGRFPGEVQPLVEEFNSVLTQNAEVIERARTQAGNLAHALKTPLSVIANAAVAKSGGLEQVVTAQVAVARKQIDYHLSRSRAAASVRVPGARTAVLPVLDGLLRVMRRIHVERNLEIVVHPLSMPVVFRGEEQDVQEMLGNLLDNACKWAVRRIEVSLAVSGGEVLITIDDDGRGIAEGERKRVLNRGERVDEHVPGSGLGLAIVDDLARLYGGRVELAESPLGGLRVVLVLPAADEPAVRDVL